MLNLIKLELKRVSLKSHFIGLLAANIVIALLSAFTSSLLNAGGGVAVTGQIGRASCRERVCAVV